jgi:hypothetical protein
MKKSNKRRFQNKINAFVVTEELDIDTLSILPSDNNDIQIEPHTPVEIPSDSNSLSNADSPKSMPLKRPSGIYGRLGLGASGNCFYYFDYILIIF